MSDQSFRAASSPPLPRLLDHGLGALAYLGGLGILTLAAARSLVRPRGPASPLLGSLVRQWDWIFGMGLPLVGLMHVGLGSFLAMQAFYGATFIEAVGPVVGTGLLRNMAPLLTGLTFAGLLAARLTSEFRTCSLVDLDGGPLDVPDRPASRAGGARPSPEPEAARLVAVRVLAAMTAGPVLGLWGSYVGIVVGCLVADVMLGVSIPLFFAKFYEMLWERDAVGLVVKGLAFPAVAVLVACHEGLRTRGDASASITAPFRAACVASLAILVLNNTWYTLAYLSGPAFGPTVLTPPPR